MELGEVFDTKLLAQIGKFFGYPEGGVGADEVHGPDFHRVRTDEDKFQNVLRTGDAADADEIKVLSFLKCCHILSPQNLLNGFKFF